MPGRALASSCRRPCRLRTWCTTPGWASARLATGARGCGGLRRRAADDAQLLVDAARTPKDPGRSPGSGQDVGHAVLLGLVVATAAAGREPPRRGGGGRRGPSPRWHRRPHRRRPRARWRNAALEVGLAVVLGESRAMVEIAWIRLATSATLMRPPACSAAMGGQVVGLVVAAAVLGAHTWRDAPGTGSTTRTLLTVPRPWGWPRRRGGCPLGRARPRGPPARRARPWPRCATNSAVDPTRRMGAGRLAGLPQLCPAAGATAFADRLSCSRSPRTRRTARSARGRRRRCARRLHPPGRAHMRWTLVGVGASTACRKSLSAGSHSSTSSRTSRCAATAGAASPRCGGDRGDHPDEDDDARGVAARGEPPESTDEPSRPCRRCRPRPGRCTGRWGPSRRGGASSRAGCRTRSAGVATGRAARRRTGRSRAGPRPG